MDTDGRSVPTISELDVFKAEPGEARPVLRDELYRLLEKSKGEQIVVDYHEFWYLWRLSHQAALKDEYNMPGSMAIGLLLLGGISFMAGFILGVVL